MRSVVWAVASPQVNTKYTAAAAAERMPLMVPSRSLCRRLVWPAIFHLKCINTACRPHTGWPRKFCHQGLQLGSGGILSGCSRQGRKLMPAMASGCVPFVVIDERGPFDAATIYGV